MCFHYSKVELGEIRKCPFVLESNVSILFPRTVQRTNYCTIRQRILKIVLFKIQYLNKEAIQLHVLSDAFKRGC